MGLLLITRFTLKEAIRKRIFFAVILLSIALLAGFAILFNIVVDASNGPVAISRDIFIYAIGGFMSIPAVWLVYLLSSVLTILLTTSMISGEIDAGTFSIIVPKPIHRFEIVLGKWLCYVCLLAIYTACLFFAFLGIIYLKTNYWPSDVVSALSILELVVLVLMGLTTLGSAMVPTLVNGAIILVLFIGAQITSFINLITPFTAPSAKDTVQNVTTTINLIMPTDALWHGASFYLTSGALDILQAAHVDTPFTSTTPIPAALVIWSVIYAVALPICGAWRFQRRDL
jgi:ABC-type transport system involved in multi-copper enzyme maturation permease subunit